MVGELFNFIDRSTAFIWLDKVTLKRVSKIQVFQV